MDSSDTPTAPLRLDGETAVLGIIGDPVAQVKAPQPLSQLLQARGFNAVLVPLHVRAGQVPALIDSLLRVHNFAGLIVTVPHKQLVAALQVDKTKAVREAQAVNVMRRAGGGWQADLLDGVGFVDNLRANGVDLAGLSVAIAGAGGAGNAIAFALAAAGVSAIEIHDVDKGKERALIARLQALGYPGREWDGRSPAQLLVNATPLGMRAADPLPIAAAAIEAGCVVADVIMEPHTTALLNLALSRGARVVHGRGMMDRQLACMADFFGEAIRHANPAGVSR